MSERTRDLAAILASLAALAGVFLLLSPVPAEDACILFRYSQHLADGHGIVWNVGEDPVEGATEFSWMILMSALIRMGLPILPASQAAGLLLSATTGLLLYAEPRWRGGIARPACLAASLAFCASTAALHAGTAFATPLFTLLVVAATQRAARMLRDAAGQDDGGRTLPLLLLLAALTRPEGVLFAGLLYLALAAGRPRLLTGRFLTRQVLLLALPGAIYFAWRWNYFGYPLPNTWYVKAAAEGIQAASVAKILKFGAFFCAPPLVAILASSALARRGERLAGLLLPAVALGYMAAYARVAMIQDVGFRFLFPAFACLLTLLPEALDRIAAGAGSGGPAGSARPWWRVAAATGIALVCVASSPRMVRASGYHTGYDDRFEVGRRLVPYRDAGLMMAVTEAGYLPFLSGWRALDPFGLNDESIAHEGLSESYLAARDPALVMFHVDTAEYKERWTPPGADRWEAMTKLLYKYVEAGDFERVAVIPKGCDPADGYHWYYLKRGVAMAGPIADQIREAARSSSRRCTDPAP